MSVHNLKKYKDSVALLPDIEKILKVLNLTERSLILFKQYTPVYKVLASIKDQKYVLEGYQRDLSIAKKSKGKS